MERYCSATVAPEPSRQRLLRATVVVKVRPDQAGGDREGGRRSDRGEAHRMACRSQCCRQWKEPREKAAEQSRSPRSATPSILDRSEGMSLEPARVPHYCRPALLRDRFHFLHGRTVPPPARPFTLTLIVGGRRVNRAVFGSNGRSWGQAAHIFGRAK
jgi:hypothetical protein